MTSPAPSGMTRERLLTLVGGLVFALALAGISVAFGLPVKRGWVAVWVALAVVLFGLGHLRRSIRDLVTIWVPLFAALWVYDFLRGQADALEGRAALGPHLDFDRWLGGGTVITVHLQRWLYDRGAAHWYDYATWVIYQSHFFVPIGAGLVLWRMGSRWFRSYMVALLVLSFLALGTYAAYPAQPPWMAGQRGAIEPVARIVHDVWKNVGVERAANVFTTSATAAGRPSSYSNQVAALPSLHGAFPVLLVMLALAAGARRRVVWVALAGSYAVAMGAVLVYGGEHYVFDILMGWAYAVVAWQVAVRVAPPSGAPAGD